MPYLEKNESDALLAAPDRSTAQGRRDHLLLLFLYNSGARADEAAQDASRKVSPQKVNPVDRRRNGNSLWTVNVISVVAVFESALLLPGCARAKIIGQRPTG